MAAMKNGRSYLPKAEEEDDKSEVVPSHVVLIFFLLAVKLEEKRNWMSVLIQSRDFVVQV